VEKYILNHVTLIGIYLILTLSLNLINGFSGLFSLGHHGFWAVGAYSSWAFMLYVHKAMPAVALFPLSICVGIVLAALFGLLVGVPCLRLRGDYLAIATLGFAEIMVVIFNNVERFGGQSGFALTVLKLQKPEAFIYGYGSYSKLIFFLILVYLFVIVTIIFIRNLVKSSHGRAIISLREDELASQLSGININRYKVLVFIMGAGFAGLAGGLFAHYVEFIAPTTFRFEEGVKILLMVVLGGMGSLSGTVIATVLIYSIEEALKFWKVQLWEGVYLADYWLIIYSAALIILMITRPQGLMGRKEINETWIYLWLKAKLGAFWIAIKGQKLEAGG